MRAFAVCGVAVIILRWAGIIKLARVTADAQLSKGAAVHDAALVVHIPNIAVAGDIGLA